MPSLNHTPGMRNEYAVRHDGLPRELTANGTLGWLQHPAAATLNFFRDLANSSSCRERDTQAGEVPAEYSVTEGMLTMRLSKTNPTGGDSSEIPRTPELASSLFNG